MLEYTEIENVLWNFLDKNNLLHLGIDYEIVNDASELKYEIPSSLVGGYILEDKTLILISNRIKNSDFLELVLKHEIFGHIAINHLSVIQKRSLLDTISSEIRNSNSNFKNEIFRITNTKSYKNLALVFKAEEIFSFIAENIKINPNHNFTPFSPKLDGSTKEKIENIIQNLAAGIRENKLKIQKDNIIQKSQDKGMSR